MAVRAAASAPSEEGQTRSTTRSTRQSAAAAASRPGRPSRSSSWPRLAQGIPLSTTIYAPAYTLTTASGTAPTTHNVPRGRAQRGRQRGRHLQPADRHAGSVNTFFVQLEERTGRCDPAQLAESLGIRRRGRHAEHRCAQWPSFVLGAQRGQPARHGRARTRRSPHTASTARRRPSPRSPAAAGKTIARPAGGVQPGARAGVADTVTDVLRGVFDGRQPARTGRGGLDRPTGRRARPAPTNDSGAAWFVGYTPQLPTAVWVGHPDGPGPPPRCATSPSAAATTARSTAARIPAPIWHDDDDRGARAACRWQSSPAADPTVARGTTIAVPDVRGLTAARGAAGADRRRLHVRRSRRARVASVRPAGAGRLHHAAAGAEPSPGHAGHDLRQQRAPSPAPSPTPHRRRSPPPAVGDATGSPAAPTRPPGARPSRPAAASTGAGRPVSSRQPAPAPPPRPGRPRPGRRPWAGAFMTCPIAAAPPRPGLGDRRGDQLGAARRRTAARAGRPRAPPPRHAPARPARPGRPTVNASAASRRFFASRASTASTSSSDSSRAALPATSSTLHRRQRHPQRRGAQLVARLHRGGQVVAAAAA